MGIEGKRRDGGGRGCSVGLVNEPEHCSDTLVEAQWT